ncbi:MAG: GNAT family N-acetyltransferase [Candidatus Saccharimonadales bacterium]
MSVDGEGLSLVRVSRPNLELAKLAQPIGLAAWHERMSRSEAEIRRVFNPDNNGKSERLLARMKEKDNRLFSPRFAGSVAYLGETAVGYCLAHDDVSGTLAHKSLKKASGKKPYAWLAQINVSPKHQGVGIGSALAKETLAAFDDDQKPTAYVFDENQLTLAWFQNRGFAPRPEAPTEKDIYFGEDNLPVMQWRLEAPSVGEVNENIVGNYQRLPSYELLDQKII